METTFCFGFANSGFLRKFDLRLCGKYRCVVETAFRICEIWFLKKTRLEALRQISLQISDLLNSLLKRALFLNKSIWGHRQEHLHPKNFSSAQHPSLRYFLLYLFIIRRLTSQRVSDYEFPRLRVDSRLVCAASSFFASNFVIVFRVRKNTCR